MSVSVMHYAVIGYVFEQSLVTTIESKRDCSHPDSGTPYCPQCGKPTWIKYQLDPIQEKRNHDLNVWRFNCPRAGVLGRVERINMDVYAVGVISKPKYDSVLSSISDEDVTVVSEMGRLKEELLSYLKETYGIDATQEGFRFGIHSLAELC